MDNDNNNDYYVRVPYVYYNKYNLAINYYINFTRCILFPFETKDIEG